MPVPVADEDPGIDPRIPRGALPELSGYPPPDGPLAAPIIVYFVNDIKSQTDGGPDRKQVQPVLQGIQFPIE
jgi:hypothetical protein